MRIDTYKFSEVDYFSKLIADYTSGQLDTQIQPPYSLGLEGIKEQLKSEYPLFIDREELASSIHQQYESIEISSVVRSNIDALKEQTTFTVVTAHQLSTFGGPLYYVIKIANAIAFSRKLKAEFPKYNFVPVYWMGSEDHDFDEINHIYLFGNKITWESTQEGPVGRFSLEGIQEAVQQVLEILGDNCPDNLDRIVKKAYAHKTPQLATRELVNSLFGKYGLVIVDGDDVSLKKAMSKVIKEELFTQPSYPLLLKRSSLLEETGYHAQATGREVNLFLLGDDFRTRIEPHESGFDINGEFWSQKRILKELDEHPENFSPNVILRPLFQQGVLPNVAFIGGGGEIAYWLQLTDIFQHYNVRYPVLIPRTSLMFINFNQHKRLRKLNLSVVDLFKEKEELKKEFLVRKEDEIPDLEKEKASIALIIEEIQAKAKDLDKTLVPSVGADGQRIQNTLNQIEGKMLRSIKQRNKIELNQIDGLFQAFFPDNSLQERHDNFMNFYSRYGKHFIDWLVQYLAVIEQEFVVITETEKLSLH